MKTITKNLTLAALLLVCVQIAASLSTFSSSPFAVGTSADTTKTDTVVAKKDTIVAKTDTVKADTVKAHKKKEEKKEECCNDTTVKDHKDPYHKIVKEGGSMREGLFTVRHIKDDWKCPMN